MLPSAGRHLPMCAALPQPVGGAGKRGARPPPPTSAHCVGASFFPFPCALSNVVLFSFFVVVALIALHTRTCKFPDTKCTSGQSWVPTALIRNQERRALLPFYDRPLCCHRTEIHVF